MHLKIKSVNTTVNSFYKNHSTFHEGDSGLDLFVTEDVVVPKGALAFMINLQITCEAFSTKEKMNNISYYLYPRSSISKTPLRMSNSVGIIDAGYRGNIMVSVDNISEETYVIQEGQRLFQICSPTLESIQTEVVEELSETSRGSGGFGSTG